MRVLRWSAPAFVLFRFGVSHLAPEEDLVADGEERRAPTEATR